ncbi:MAG: diaminopropionate ammonia-lyase [Rhodovibrionaceae bacterium]|nr:diaminopropionate ammonia-lyase [Rhodovibrionaceae bacterium]
MSDSDTPAATHREPGYERTIVTAHCHRETAGGDYPRELDAVISAQMAEDARAEISTWPGYAPTPLVALPALAQALSIEELLYKDESERFGLGSFKALGGAYAVLRLATEWLESHAGTQATPAAIRAGDFRERLKNLTVVTATDGNHGRSVAWGAQMAGCRCRIYIHAGVSQGRQQAMEALGAEVVRIDGDYDDSLRLCAREAADNGWFVVSDTSYEGYMDVPRQVMAGYTVMADEVLDRIADRPPSHVFIQAGVGGLAASVLARFWQRLGERRPRVVIVEPERAACVLESARRDRPAAVKIEEETVMAGLSCGEVSLLAWQVLARGAEDFISIGEDEVAPVMRLLAAGKAGERPIVAGESAVPGLIGLIGVAARPDLRRAIGLDADSRVLVFGCEGATDPEIYRAIIEEPAAWPPSLPELGQ